MKDTVTLKELAAIVVRRGRLIVILTLIFALLLGCRQAYSQISKSRSEENSPEKIEERYQKALEAYGKNKEDLEKKLSKAKRQLESQRTYNAESLLLEIDPYNKAVTTVNFSLTDVDEDAFNQVFRLESTPVDFIISKIQSQYVILWNSLDLRTALKGGTYGSIQDKYLREVVTLSRMDGGGLTLKAYAASEAESRRLADAAYACLLESRSVISEGSYRHDFTILSNVTKILIDQDLESTQQSALDKIETYENDIESLTKQLEDLKEPERETGTSVSAMVKSTVKFAVLGAAVGLVMGVTLIMASYIFRNRAETSRQLEEGLSVPFLGSIARPAGLWNRLADRILGERCWPDEDQALAYISASAGALLPESGGVLVVSSLPLAEESVRPVIKALENRGRTVRFVGAAGRSPETAEALRACGCAVLAERTGSTHWNDVTELAALAKSLDKPLSGFVTV